MEWRQENGWGRSTGQSRKDETPKNGRSSNNFKKCPKGNSRNLRGGGPKSSQGKDGKGWSDSSQQKINQYFKGIGAIKEGESHGNSANPFIPNEEYMSSVPN